MTHVKKSAAARVFAAAALPFASIFIMTACSSTTAHELAVGDCFTLPSADETVSVDIVECTKTHNAEVIAELTIVNDLAPELRPDDSVIDSFGTTECSSAFRNYVGASPEDTTFEIRWLKPSLESWDRGDRALTCLAVAAEGETLNESLRSPDYVPSGDGAQSDGPTTIHVD